MFFLHFGPQKTLVIVFFSFGVNLMIISDYFNFWQKFDTIAEFTNQDFSIFGPNWPQMLILQNGHKKY